MKKTVVPIAVLLGLLLLGSTSLAVGPEKLWWTEFTSKAFTWSAAVPCTYMFEGSDGAAAWYMVVGDANARLYEGTVLLGPQSVRVPTDEPGLNCMEIEDGPHIRPGQPVRFHIGWLAKDPMTHQDAEDLLDSLSYSVMSDCEPRWTPLERQGTHPYYQGIDWSKAFCPWTVRP